MGTTIKKQIVISKVTKVENGVVTEVEQYLPVTALDNVYSNENLNQKFTDALKANPNTYIDNVTDKKIGLMSPEDKQHLDALNAASGNYEMITNKISVEEGWRDQATTDTYLSASIVKSELEKKKDAIDGKLDKDEQGNISVDVIETGSITMGGGTIQGNRDGKLYIGQVTDGNAIVTNTVLEPVATKAQKGVDDAAAASQALETFKAGKNEANGWVGLDSSKKISASLLPSYVDDVLEFDNKAAFPKTGEAGKIYVAKDTDKTYRWGGSTYTEISASLALGTGDNEAYEGSAGALDRENIGKNATEIARQKELIDTQQGVIDGHATAIEGLNSKTTTQGQTIATQAESIKTIKGDAQNAFDMAKANEVEVAKLNSKINAANDINNDNTSKLATIEANYVKQSEITNNVNNVTVTDEVTGANGVKSVERDGKTLKVVRTKYLVESDIADVVKNPNTSVQYAVARFSDATGKAVESSDRVLVNSTGNDWSLKIANNGNTEEVVIGSDKIKTKTRVMNYAKTAVMRREKGITYTHDTTNGTGSYDKLPAGDVNVGDFFFATFTEKAQA